MRHARRIAVVIPALDEADSLPVVLHQIPPWADDILVVDNGSTDATAARAQANGARVVAEGRRGYGSACVAGIRALRQPDIVVFLDADGSSDPREMHLLVDPIATDGHDFVVGSRMRGVAEKGALIWTQRWGNGLACWLMRRIWRFDYTDLGPFRAIRHGALAQLAMHSPDYGWTVEMQIKALAHHLRIAEVPVSYRRRYAGASKISGRWRSTLLAGRRILGMILTSRWRVGSK